MKLISQENPNITIDLDECFQEYCEDRLYRNVHQSVPLITINNQFRRWVHFNKVFPTRLRLNVSQCWDNEAMIKFFEEKLEMKLCSKLRKFGIPGFNGINVHNDAGRLVKPRVNKLEVMRMVQNDLGKKSVTVWNKEFRKRTGLKRGLAKYQCLGLWSQRNNN